MTKNEILKAWIAYLKNNQIAELQSQPNGQLNYRKQPTQEDLKKFLSSYFSDESISAVIAAEPPAVKEAIVDRPSPAVSEAAVERIIDKLLSLQQPAPTDPRNIPVKDSPQKVAVLNKIKSVIARMDDNQRRALHRELSSKYVAESTVTNNELRGLLKTAAATKNISANTIVKHWRDSHYPNSTEDLSKMLSNLGFSEDDIKLVFSQVMGTETGEYSGQDTIAKVADVTRKMNLTKEVLAILKSDYQLTECVIEYVEIEKILNMIVECDRSVFLRNHEKQSLGKNKKV